MKVTNKIRTSCKPKKMKMQIFLLFPSLLVMLELIFLDPWISTLSEVVSCILSKDVDRSLWYMVVVNL